MLHHPTTRERERERERDGSVLLGTTPCLDARCQSLASPPGSTRDQALPYRQAGLPGGRSSQSAFTLPCTVTSRAGFTLIELLIYTGVFAGIMVAFIAILVAVTSIQARQSSVVEVNQQSQFLLQQIQYYTERSSVIELPENTATTTLKLRMAASTEDPTYFTLSNGIVYLQQTDSGALNALTSNKVTVSGLTFTKRSNAPSHDSVSVSFTVAYNTASLKQQFTQSLQFAVARVSAATFDSNVIPSSTATYDLGVTANSWRSINSTVYFSSGNVGIGTTNPTYALDISGGFRATATSTFSGSVGIGTSSPAYSLVATGTIYSANGGFRFPDGTTQTTAASAGAASANVQVFTSSSTWTKPSGAKYVFVRVIGPGGGGGSGRVGAASTYTAGGAGGGGGAANEGHFDPSVLGATETVTIGTGGSGGAAQSTNSTNGNSGGNGSGASSFGTWILAGAGAGGGGGQGVGTGGGGGGGTAGNASGNAGGAPRALDSTGSLYTSALGGAGGENYYGGPSTGSDWGGGAGAVSLHYGSNLGGPASGWSSIHGGGGGGGGGGISDNNTTSTGGAGGTSASYSSGGGGAGGTSGGAGTAGSSNTTTKKGYGGDGGGGGASSGTANSGAGANGGIPGGGGGGSGAARNGFSSGAGGNGARGEVVVVTYF